MLAEKSKKEVKEVEVGARVGKGSKKITKSLKKEKSLVAAGENGTATGPMVTGTLVK